LKTKKGFEELLKRVMASTDLTEELEADMTALREFFNETDAVLRKYGQVYEGEDIDDYEYKENEIVPETSDYETKYKELKQQYIDRFFGGTTPDEIKEDEIEDIEEDSANKTINDLFNKGEE
jgi:hypothetical protein